MQCAWLSQKAAEVGRKTGEVEAAREAEAARKRQEGDARYSQAPTVPHHPLHRYSEGDIPSALQCYSLALRHNPRDSLALSNRAACHHKLQQWQLCIEDCDRSIALNPGLQKSYLRKASAFKSLGNAQEAMAAYRLFLTSNWLP